MPYSVVYTCAKTIFWHDVTGEIVHWPTRTIDFQIDLLVLHDDPSLRMRDH